MSSETTRKYVVAQCDTCHKKFSFEKDGITANQLRDEIWLYCPDPFGCSGKITEVMPKCFGIGNDNEKECETCEHAEDCAEEAEARSEHYYMVG